MGKKINQSADNSTKINHMLGLSDKDFKTDIIKLIQWLIKNSWFFKNKYVNR